MATKNDVVRLRLPASMSARWRHAATQTGASSLSEWLRDVVDVSAISGINVDGLRSELAMFRAELGRGAGNLLDQVAERLHIDAKSGHAPNAVEHERALIQAAADVSAMRKQLDRALGSLARRRS